MPSIASWAVVYAIARTTRFTLPLVPAGIPSKSPIVTTTRSTSSSSVSALARTTGSPVDRDVEEDPDRARRVVHAVARDLEPDPPVDQRSGKRENLFLEGRRD